MLGLRAGDDREYVGARRLIAVPVEKAGRPKDLPVFFYPARRKSVTNGWANRLRSVRALSWHRSIEFIRGFVQRASRLSLPSRLPARAAFHARRDGVRARAARCTDGARRTHAARVRQRSLRRDEHARSRHAFWLRRELLRRGLLRALQRALRRERIRRSKRCSFHAYRASRSLARRHYARASFTSSNRLSRAARSGRITSLALRVSETNPARTACVLLRAACPGMNEV